MISYIRDNYVKQIEFDDALVKKNSELIAMTEKYKEFEDKKPIFKSFVNKIEKALIRVNPDGFFFPIRPQNTFKKVIT